MANKRTRRTPLPKQIRSEVKSILQNADQHNGVHAAALLFIDDRGRFRAVGSGSEIFHKIISNAMPSISASLEIAAEMFNAGVSAKTKTA